MTSQTWRSTDDVDDPEWNHWMGVYVPNGPIVGTALMAIAGGRLIVRDKKQMKCLDVREK